MFILDIKNFQLFRKYPQPTRYVEEKTQKAIRNIFDQDGETLSILE